VGAGSESGEQLPAVRILNDPVVLRLQFGDAGADPEIGLRIKEFR
jgi:hypothetical protein